MTNSQKTLSGVDAVADADTIKNLIKLGKGRFYQDTNLRIIASFKGIIEFLATYRVVKKIMLAYFTDNALKRRQSTRSDLVLPIRPFLRPH